MIVNNFLRRNVFPSVRKSSFMSLKEKLFAEFMKSSVLYYFGINTHNKFYKLGYLYY